MKLRRLDRSTLWITVGLLGLKAGCGTGAGDSTACHKLVSCEAGFVSAVDAFSNQGCVTAVDSYWCGVHAQALAECLQNAQVCLETGATRDKVMAILATSVCAAELAEWDDCFGNGGESDGDSDSDWD